MLYGMYLSATGMAMNRHAMDVIANNLANTDTVGFKRDQAVFRQRLQEALTSASGGQCQPEYLRAMTGGAFVSPTHTDFSQGPTETTSRALDIALQGPGMLAVQDGEGTAYSRDGRLSLVGGRLVRAIDGRPVLDDGGRVIDLGSETPAGEVTIDSDGRELRKGKVEANLGIVEFENPQDLAKLGGNLFQAFESPKASGSTRVVPGALEQSVVNPSQELVAMISTSRSYQINTQMISIQDQCLSRLVNELPKL